MKLLASILVLVLLVASCAEGQRDMARQLEPAQALLQEKRFDEAYDEYLRYAERGNHLAMFTVGMFHKVGWGRDINDGKAAEWFKKSAEGDIPVGLHYYAEYMTEGKHLPADPARAAELFRRSAELGHFLSLASLAELHLEGKGVPKDVGAALALLKQAGDRGVIPAQLRMADLFLSGEHGVAKDPAAAYSWYHAAANLEDTDGLHMLGVMERDGLGRPRAPHVARGWFESAAALGHAPSCIPTAELYLADHADEKPHPEDLAKAYMWLSAAKARLTDPAEKERADALLRRVLADMPEEWKPDLDAKVDAHLKECEEE